MVLCWILVKRFHLDKKLPVTVAILLGGESRRFGSPKAFLEWKGKSLAAHLAVTAGESASEVLLVGKNAGQIPPDAVSLGRFVADEPGWPGPLAGFAAALSQASRPWIFLTGVDMPCLSEKTLREFWRLREKSVLLDAVVPHVEDRWQPLCALWNKHALKILGASRPASFQDFLKEGALKVLQMEESALRSWDPDLLSLKSFNTPEEWEKIQPLAESH